jgi:hypothetical protein
VKRWQIWAAGAVLGVLGSLVADSGAEAVAIVLLLCAAVWLGEAIESVRQRDVKRPTHVHRASCYQHGNGRDEMCIGEQPRDTGSR